MPCVLGWLKPAILMPPSVLGCLSPDEIEAILAHELAHVRRWDYLVNLLQTALETLLFYHPAVWWISARMNAERENCCDDLAVAVCGNRQVYAGALAMLAELQLPALSAPAASGWQLLPRIRRIVGGGPDHAPRRASWLPPLLVLGVLAAIGSFMLLGGARAGDAKAAPAKENAHEEVRDLPPDLLKDAVVTDVTQNADPARADEVLASVLVHQNVVYASCPKGLYRASTTDRKWAQIEVPERMPLNGFFAEEASADSSIYYYAPQWTGWKMPKADTKTFGLYRSDASGEKWELLSTDHDFTHVYVHEDKTIYAIAAVTEKEETRTVYYDRILRLTDSGKHWEDILARHAATRPR